MKKKYLPISEAQRIIWLNNFAQKIGSYAPLFGISTTEVTTIGNMDVLYSYVINLIKQSSTYSKQLTQFKKLLSIAPVGTTLGAMPKLIPATAPALTQAGIFTYISGIVKRIKGNIANYTDAIGKDLGIIGEDIVDDFVADDFASAISLKTLPGSVVVTFTKDGVDGVNVYSHPVGSTDPNAWERLGFDAHPPYHDTRPLAVAGTPEKRTYRVRAVIDDVEVGQWSNEAVISFVG